MSETLRVDRHGPVTVVTIDRPERRNAVDRVTADALFEAFQAFDADGDASVAVLTGAGGNFCAGADLQAIASGAGNRVAEDGAGPMGPTRLALSKPVIAAVEGFAVAGGLELAVWCDLPRGGCGRHARCVLPAVRRAPGRRRHGPPSPSGGRGARPRPDPDGRGVGADEALGMGLVNRVVPPGSALGAAVAWAAEIAALPQVCLRNDRRSAIDQWGRSVPDALLHETRLGLDSLRSGEALEGAARFAGGVGRGGATAPVADSGTGPA